VQATATGATIFRAVPSTGMQLSRAPIQSMEFRADAQVPMARLGSKSLAASYKGELSQGTFKALIAAVLRSAFDADLTTTQATITTITTTTNQVVSGGTGSFLSATGGAIKIGDIFRLSAGANANRNLGPVLAVTTGTIVVATGQLVAQTTAIATFTLTRPAKVINAAVFTRASFTVEEVNTILDDSKIGTGARVGSIKLTFPANGMVGIEVGFVGADMTNPGSAASPYFTAPSITTSVGLTAVDASIRFAGGAVVTLSSVEIDIDLTAKGMDVVGSVITPDVFENNCAITAKITGLRNDMSNVAAFLAETEADLAILCVEPESEPKSFVSFFLPRVKRMTISDSGVGNDGGITETMDLVASFPITAGAGTSYDNTTIAIQDSI
jgi:hypothetical protein